MYEIYLHDAHKNAIISVISIYSDISSDADASKNRFGTEFVVYTDCIHNILYGRCIMEFLRKSLKVYAAALILFVLLTLALAAVLRYTAFSAGWSFAGLLVIMSVVAAFTGLLEGRLTGKKGMLTGAAAAAVFVLVIILAAGGIFAGSFGMESFSVVYLIPVAAGAVGGVFGANMGS